MQLWIHLFIVENHNGNVHTGLADERMAMSGHRGTRRNHGRTIRTATKFYHLSACAFLGQPDQETKD